MLGFASQFNVRQLEKRGRLHAIRGAMGQAWYPRSEVLALQVDGPDSGPRFPDLLSPRRWSDAELILYLRGRPTIPTIVDLVADTGVSIARAERVYRLWLAHDTDVAAQAARAAYASGVTPPDPKPETVPAPAPSGADVRKPEGHLKREGASERRGGERIERDRLIQELRDADPTVRARAFQKLRSKRRGNPR